MTISALTSDDLKEPDREKTQLTRLNQLINALTGVTSENVSIGGTLAVAGNTTLGDSDSDAHTFKATVTTFRTTGADSNAVARFTNDARTWQVGVLGSGSDAFYLSDITGSKNPLIVSSDNKISLGEADASLGFYGATPVAKQTGVAVSAAGIHAALVALGLIGV